MSDNLKVWNELKAVPAAAKKTIFAGRLKGMTDIKPQWRLKMMTEQFGAIGIGWYYTIDKTWTETLEGETSAHVQVSLYIKDTDNVNWSAPIPGIGGSMLLALEKQRTKPFHSDEAYKMATTDALSVAMKQLGVAADVYMGLSDSKYDKPVEKPHVVEFKKATEHQIKLLNGYMKDFTAKNDSKSVEYIAEHLAKNDLSYEQAEFIINRAKDKI
jgi:hypothetical protein